MTSPLVTIVIPTYNRVVMTKRLLQSIYSSSYKNIEVIVIDDCSTDNTSKILTQQFKKKERFKIYRNKKNLFSAASRNIGLKKALGKYILFIDDDNVVDKNMIKNLVEEIEKDKQIGEIGPVNYSFSKKDKILWSKTTRNMRTSKTNQSRTLKDFNRKKTWETDDILNSYMIRMSILKNHKIQLNEEYGIMYEESDLAYRIKNLGYKIIVVRKAKIYHDIEKYKNNELISDYMDHFMTDKRRPYVTARNRIIFHAKYSNRLEAAEIFLFWMWIFALYYSKKILFYKQGDYSLKRKIELVLWYYKGIWDGMRLVLQGKSFSN